jgi:hypothetical protein
MKNQILLPHQVHEPTRTLQIHLNDLQRGIPSKTPQIPPCARRKVIHDRHPTISGQQLRGQTASNKPGPTSHHHPAIPQHAHPQPISPRLLKKTSKYPLFPKTMQTLRQTQLNKQVHVKFQRISQLPPEGLRYNVSQDLYSYRETYTTGITLSTHRHMPIRNRPIITLLLPAIIFLFAVGWLLYSLGERRRKPPQQAKHTTTKEDKIEIHIAMTEEPEEYNDQPA